MTQQKRRLGLSVPETLYEKLSAIAVYHGKTINSTCLDIFWDYFKKSELHDRSIHNPDRQEQRNQ